MVQNHFGPIKGQGISKLFQSPDTLFSRVHYESIFLLPLMALSSHSRRGKCLIWDFTCIDMLSGKSCLSYFNKSDKVTEAKINYLIQSTFLDTGYLFSQLNIFFLEKFDTKFLHMKHTETGANTHQIF